MIELRPRKLARLQLSVSGSDRAGGDAPEQGQSAGPAAEICPQGPGGAVRKRSRKPKIGTPVPCKKESGETALVCRAGALPETSLSQDHEPVKKRGRKPKVLKDPGCVQPSCVSEALGPRKARGQKPKASKPEEWEGMKSGQGTAEPKETGHGSMTSVRPPDEGAGPQAASTQNNRQVARGRRLKASKQREWEVPKSDQGTEQPKENSHGGVTSVRPPDEGAGPQASCTQNRVQVARGRKSKASKQSEWEVPISGQGAAQPKGNGHGRVISIRVPDEGAGPQAANTQNTVQVKKRGRKPKIQPSVICEELETGDMSHGECADPDSRTKEEDQVSVCSDRSQPKRRKEGRKPESGKGVKSQASQKELKGFSCAGKSKIHTIRVRVQRSLLSQVSEKMGVPPGDIKCEEKSQSRDPLREEERTRAEVTSPETKPSNSRRIKRIWPISTEEKQSILVSAEQDTRCLKPACEKDEDKIVKSTMSESTVVTCSSSICHVHSPGLQNPVVCLRSCKKFPLHSFNNRTIGPRKMFTRKMQNQTSHIDSVTSVGDSISELENVKHNEKVANSASPVNNKSHVKTILKVKFNFRKRGQKNNHSEESDTELKSIDQKTSEDFKSKLKASSHNENLMDELNNNTIKSTESGFIDEESKDPICSPGGSWRSRVPFNSDEESDHHDYKSSNITFSPTNVSEAEEGLAVTCQRVIPFTGKTIRKWSCARTYVPFIPRKRPADDQSTVILGIEADNAQEIQSDGMPSQLESNNGESIQECAQENESEATCEKRKLDLHVESTSPSRCISSVSTLDPPLSGENKSDQMSREELLPTSDTSLSLPLASELSIEKLNGKCCKLPGEVKEPDVEYMSQQLPREDKTIILSCNPPLEMEIDHNTVTNLVLINVPNEESRALPQTDVPIECKKELQNEVFYMSSAPEEVNPNVVKGGLKGSHKLSDLEDVQSNSCPSDGFSIGDSANHEACDGTVTFAPTSTKKSTNNNTLDLLKAYEEDVLVLDVNEEDPELFDFSFKEEGSSKQRCIMNSVSWSKGSNTPSISKVQKKARPPMVERKKEIKRIEYIPESNTDVINNFFDGSTNILVESGLRKGLILEKKIEMVSGTARADLDPQDTCNTLPETNEMTVFAEMEESREPKESQDKDDPIELHHASMLGKSSSLSQDVLPTKHLWQPQPLFNHPKSQPWINSPPQWVHDFQSGRKNRLLTNTATSDRWEKWNQEKAVPRVQSSFLPTGYCKYFFNTFPGCLSSQCKFLHIPRNCDERVCMDLLRKLINENKTLLLKRAVWIFRNYYSQYPPRLQYDRGIFPALLNPLVNLGLWQDLVDLLETAAAAKIFPSLEQIIKVFESVAISGLQTALSHLLDVFCKFVHNGMSITPKDIDHIMAIMIKFNAAKNQINILLSLKSSLEMKISKANWAYYLDVAVSEVEHCKVNSDWMKLGTLYLTVCTGCEDLTNLKNFSSCIAEALKKDAMNERTDIPYCEFADYIFKNCQFNDIQKNILGRIGISVMFFYHQKEQWIKGRKVIYKFHELKINYTVLKGISGQESCASRCHVVNVAVEIFLKCGNLGRAVQTLKECDWIINTSMWPCDMMDVLHRHNLLCLLVHAALSKNKFNMCFDVLQNLPGFQESQADLNVSQYTVLFNKLLSSCVENRSIGMSSSVIDFMIDKKIAVDYVNLRGFILTLGHSGLWTKARGYYKCALALGFYPLFEGKTNPNILYIPSFMSEIEMLMTIEHFMVSNATSIKSQGGCDQTLQIVLKRMDEDNAKCKDSYHAATERLCEASRLSTPRLFIKHMTVNKTHEQVYTLDNNSSLKWLNENMKWAGNVWCSFAPI